MKNEKQEELLKKERMAATYDFIFYYDTPADQADAWRKNSEDPQNIVKLCAFVKNRAPEEFKKFMTYKYDAINEYEAIAAQAYEEGDTDLYNSKKNTAKMLREEVNTLQQKIDNETPAQNINDLPEYVKIRLDMYFQRNNKLQQEITIEPSCSDKISEAVSSSIDYLNENNPIRLLEKYITNEKPPSKPRPKMPHTARSSEYYNGR